MSVRQVLILPSSSRLVRGYHRELLSGKSTELLGYVRGIQGDICSYLENSGQWHISPTSISKKVCDINHRK